MKDPVTAETWMMAFGKDFGGMCQGNNTMGQKGMNVMFVMLPVNIPNIRGSGGKNLIFSNGPNSTFECFNLL